MQPKHVLQHETKRHLFIKFLIVLLIFFIYFLFVSNKYGVENGFLVTALTWSFFVLCTPIAEAGVLIDFPIRLLFKLRMFYGEMIVWVIAITLNIVTFFTRPGSYTETGLLQLFHHILEQPWPFWLIILISGIGTFISIQFGDELLDKVKHHEREKYHKHKNKYRLVFMVFLFLIAIVLYNFLLKELGVNI